MSNVDIRINIEGTKFAKTYTNNSAHEVVFNAATLADFLWGLTFTWDDITRYEVFDFAFSCVVGKYPGDYNVSRMERAIAGHIRFENAPNGNGIRIEIINGLQ